MEELTLLANEVKQGQSPQPQAGSITAGTVPSILHLLDVISSIIAEEYIVIAKQNPGVFIKQGVNK